jgi:cell division transport system permease protein
VRLHQAFGYFVREALVNLVRSWKVSLLAISTIAVSLFIGGCFLLVATSLSQVLETWKRGGRVVVYLAPGVPVEAARELTAVARDAAWFESLETVSPAEARRRFADSFPSVADLVEGWEDEPLPASVEIAFDPGQVEPEAFREWLAELRASPGVAMVDDDRDWLAQIEAALRFVTALGLGLGAVLLAAAIFTIASVIRLTAYLHRQEIGVMRLVGATELFIRGPFYIEGLLQGLLGGIAALAALFALHGALAMEARDSLVAGVLQGGFLTPSLQALLVSLGAAAGLAGALVSLRREEL